VGGQPSRWLANRDLIARSADSRRFVDDILDGLKAGRFSPAAWATFFGGSLVRSVDQARMRPVAAIEVTALHLLAGAARSWRWAFVSWFLCIAHLGLLGDRSTLGCRIG
jgi:hypothetical protein